MFPENMAKVEFALPVYVRLSVGALLAPRAGGASADHTYRFKLTAAPVACSLAELSRGILCH